jgi:hypothetical protein
MKPYDGGAWVGVSKIRSPAELHAAYDVSGERLMHLQASVEGYDVFVRSLTIGPETMVMKFRPELPILRWTGYCVVTGRRARLDTDMSAYFAVADQPGLSYAEKLQAYRRLADDCFEVERYATAMV